MACLSPFRYNGIVRRKGGVAMFIFLLLLMLKTAGCPATGEIWCSLRRRKWNTVEEKGDTKL